MNNQNYQLDEKSIHTVTKPYSLFGYYATSDKELLVAERVLSSLLELIQSQGIDLHFRRKPTVQKDFDFETENMRYLLTMRVALLLSDTEIGKQYDHSKGSEQINLNVYTKEETA